MRMRRKKHLEDRLAACSELFINIEIDNLNPLLTSSQREIFSVKNIFGNNNPVHVEIGCGKGQFVLESAKRYPEINFIAVEKLKNVIIDAAEKIQSENVTNVLFINCPAEFLGGFFNSGSVERLYLNFSCPYPKQSYHKRRLTHERFLNIYQRFLVSDGEIHMKTDNAKLFEYSINSISGFGMKLKNVTFDLHNSDFEGNIVTEYEKKFTQAGLPIYRLEAINLK